MYPRRPETPYPLVLDPDELPDEAERERVCQDLIDMLIVDHTPSSIYIEFLWTRLRENRFLYPGILAHEPPLFLLCGYCVVVEWLALIRQTTLWNRLLQLRDRQGRTFVHFAAANGKIRLLIDAGFRDCLAEQAGILDNQGLLPLHYSVLFGYREDVDALLQIDSSHLRRLTPDGESALDLSLANGEFALAYWLMTEPENLDWRALSPRAFHQFGAHRVGLNMTEYVDGLKRILPLLLDAGFEPNVRDDGDSLLLRATCHENLLLLREVQSRCRDRFTASDRAIACAAACRGNSPGIVEHFIDYWGVDVKAEDGKGRSLLSRAVQGCAHRVVQFLFARGADPDAIDSKGPPTARERAREMEDSRIAECFAPRGRILDCLPLDQGSTPRGGLTLWMHASVLLKEYVETGSKILHVENATGHDLTLDSLFEFLCVIPCLHCPNKPSSRGSVSLVTCLTCGGDRCQFRIRWNSSEALTFVMNVRRMCPCCFAARWPTQSLPARGVRLVLKSGSVDTRLPPHHPARVLAKTLFRHCKSLPGSLKSFLGRFLHVRTMYRRDLVTTHVQSFEHFISTLHGDIRIECLPLGSDGAQSYPLQYHGGAVVTLAWIAPWASAVLMSGEVLYLELDASFYALRPYAYVIPFAVIANYGIPLGLIMTPTERQESYEIFYQGVVRVGVDSAVLDALPILSDEGTGLGAYARAHSLIQYFCFRHRLALLGSGTFVALLARRLFFCGTETEYRHLKAVTIIDFEVARREGAITAEGVHQFCRFFGLQFEPDGHCIELPEDPFVSQALWSGRGSAGVATCSNHSEGSHGRFNGKTSGRLSLVRRLAVVIQMITSKVEKFSPEALNRSARKTFQALEHWASKNPGEACETPCRCGWDHIYACRYQLENFPCRHTIHACSVDWRRPHIPGTLARDGATMVRSTAYSGVEWPLPRTRVTEIVLPISEADDVSPSSGDRRAFIERFAKEMTLSFPHLRCCPEDLHFRYGRFLCADAPDTAEHRAKFQVLIFRECTRNRWHPGN
jgi:ankyrin repeat protein